MQNVVLLMIVGLAAIIAIVGAGAVMARKGHINRLQLGLGIAAGLVAAFVALVAQVDLVPDGPEEVLEEAFVVGLTLIAIIVSWYRIARA